MKDYNYERFTDDNIERAIRDAAGVENKTKFLHRRLELLLLWKVLPIRAEYTEA